MLNNFKYDKNKLINELSKYPIIDKHLNYGTAGFRDNYNILHGIFIRMGILASLRSSSLDSNCIGVMITASHNPEEDNGIKLIDKDGGMLHQSWEIHAESLANTSLNDVDDVINELSMKYIKSPDSKSIVIVGRDTRPHSYELTNCVITGANICYSNIFDIGEVTTPQLHFIIQCINTNYNYEQRLLLTIEHIQQALDKYYSTIGDGYISLIQSNDSSNQIDHIIVDGACGIGAKAITKMSEYINKQRPNTLSIDLRNNILDGKINDDCGAEYVQKNQLPPKNINESLDNNKLICSYDGDADRIVFHSYINNHWILIDGDKISVFISLLISQEINQLDLSNLLTIGVIQTAYANGSSTNYINKLGITIGVAKTGVKYLHHKALEYDIGIYFEANGHGTVLFSDKYNIILKQLESRISTLSRRQQLALHRLIELTKIINQAVGDAVSDMLVCLVALRILNISHEDWHLLYQDLPSKQLKTPVSNKNLIKCSDDETRIIEPIELQVDLDRLVDRYLNGRCFIRPSGTENVVRIYAEASTQNLADELANKAIELIDRYIV